MEETKNDTFPFFSCAVDVFCLVKITLQYLEHPWIIKMLLLVCLRDLFVAFPKVKQLFRNTTQRYALRQCGYRWHGVCENMGGYVEQLSPPVVWDFTPEQVRHPDKLTQFEKRILCPWQCQRDAIYSTVLGPGLCLLSTIEHCSAPSRGRRI